MNIQPELKRLSLIAGNGWFPQLFIESAHDHGIAVDVIALKGETSQVSVQQADRIHYLRVGQLQALLDTLHRYGNTQVAMAGGVQKSHFFFPFYADKRAWSLANQLLQKRDDAILRALAAEIEAEGFTVIASTAFLAHAYAVKGVWTTRQPTLEEQRDLDAGFLLAKQLGVADIGQTVVLQNGIPLAIEAIEGTDACLKRGARLGHLQTVAVKVSKPSQDLRFDLPVIGVRTIKTMNRAGMHVLGVESGHVLVIDLPKVIRLANRCAICIVGL